MCYQGLFCLSSDVKKDSGAKDVDDVVSYNSPGTRIYNRIKTFHDSIDLMHYTSALAVVNMLLNKSHEWVHEIGNSKIEKYEDKVSKLINDHNNGVINLPASRITLIVEYFQPKKVERLQEILQVMWINVNNKYISNICILTEEEGHFENLLKEMRKFCMLTSMKKKKKDCIDNLELTLVNQLIGERATFKHAIDYGQKHIAEGYMIIANVDIYFDDSLKFIAYNSKVAINDETYLNKKCYALLRYECLNGTPGDVESIKKMNIRSDSQDAWIMPIPFIFNTSNANFYFGKVGADNSFIHLLRDQNIHVSSPSLTIRTSHLHRIKGSRTYSHLDHVSFLPSQIKSSPYVKVGYRLY